MKTVKHTGATPRHKDGTMKYATAAIPSITTVWGMKIFHVDKNVSYCSKCILRCPKSLSDLNVQLLHITCMADRLSGGPNLNAGVHYRYIVHTLN
jgi:hypothetical protein